MPLPTLPLDTTFLRPGLRLAVGLSGGADSVALLRALADQSRELGIVLHAAHLHHGLRGAEADDDLAFCKDLAGQLNIPFHHSRVDTAAAALPDKSAGKSAESIEEAARRLRYSWFRQLLAKEPLDAVVTAHTLDDQAETVLAKFLRGAWTEGLSGIHPVLEKQPGLILRPLLSTTRAEIEAYLTALQQPWREDSSNRHLTFARNRIRHELLPLLETWNPRLREHLAQMASLARNEETWWQVELERIAPQLILPGRPVRGGGRASSEGLALDITRLVDLPLALQRRLLRHAARQLGAAPDFAATESMRSLAISGRAGQKLELAHGVVIERTHRELRLAAGPGKSDAATQAIEPSEYEVPIPGSLDAPAFGLRITIAARQPISPDSLPAPATLRRWKPGDRVRLRHSSSSRKVKEVLERMKVAGTDRSAWPVLVHHGNIVWMQGVEVEPDAAFEVSVSILSTLRPDTP